MERKGLSTSEVAQRTGRSQGGVRRWAKTQSDAGSPLVWRAEVEGRVQWMLDPETIEVLELESAMLDRSRALEFAEAETRALTARNAELEERLTGVEERHSVELELTEAQSSLRTAEAQIVGLRRECEIHQRAVLEAERRCEVRERSEAQAVAAQEALRSRVAALEVALTEANRRLEMLVAVPVPGAG